MPGRQGVLGLIGNTPMVRLRRIFPHRSVQIWAKLESFNPGGSVKDRVALWMIEGAERRGQLRPGRIVLEATSGNTGIGLALVCAIKGYRLILAMSEGSSVERRKILRAYGADLILTPSERGTDGAIEMVYQMAREEPETYFVPDQFNNPDNWRAHYEGTGEEIWRDTQGRVTHVVAGIGTSGTLMGVARRLKEHRPGIQIVGVEPKPGHAIQGLKNLKESYVPGIFDKGLLDLKINVEDEEALEMARRLAKEEGIFAGMSAGAAVAGALKVAKGLREGLLVVVLPDGGDRYLSTSLFVPRELPTLRFYNTMSRKKEHFEPLEPGKVRLYSCGPTVDSRIDLGVCRRMVVADLLKRYLQYKGFQVRHVMNITDLDDRTIKGAAAAGMDLRDFTEGHLRAFFEDLAALRVQPADVYPKASEHVDQMIQLARRLQEKGFAYEQHGSLYFDISKFRAYGRLSRVDLRKIRIGCTVDLDDYEKDNPRDFTLFKRSTLWELKQGLFFSSPWGNVRPGWHIECAVMATHYLGDTIDIHTSSRSLVFPHHENEIAICEAASGQPFARYWLHSETVLKDGRKMAPENHNVLTLKEILQKGYTGREVRFFLLSTHYRKPLVFQMKGLFASRRSLRRLDHFVLRLQTHGGEVRGEREEGGAEVGDWVSEAREGFESAMDDDLNVSGALAAVFRLVKRVNSLLDTSSLGEAARERIMEFVELFDGVFQVLDFPCGGELDEEVHRLIEARNRAREREDWEEADRIRERLHRLGVHLVDTPSRTFWFLRRNSDERI